VHWSIFSDATNDSYVPRLNRWSTTDIGAPYTTPEGNRHRIQSLPSAASALKLVRNCAFFFIYWPVCGPLAALAGIKGGKAAAALFHGAERDDEATRERRTFYVNRVPMKWMFVGGSREIEVYATRRACDTATICTVCLRRFFSQFAVCTSCSNSRCHISSAADDMLLPPLRRLCFCLYLFVCQQDNSESCRWISMRCSGRTRRVIATNGVDRDHDMF